MSDLIEVIEQPAVVVEVVVQGPAGPQGIQGLKGDTGAQGIQGSSAYEVAVADGFVGTEADWLASLVGPQGAQGPQGIQGIQGDIGPQGIQGLQGNVGPQGIQGIQGVQGDIGPQGIQGVPGADGNTILYGVGAPSDALGADGNFYIATDTNYLYGPKAAGAWPAGTSMIGPQGPQGVPGTGNSIEVLDEGVSLTAQALSFNFTGGGVTATHAGGAVTVDVPAVTKAGIGLGNVDNTADADKPVSTATQAALNLKLDSSQVGASNGVAPLGADSKVPAAYLPSYVDDVLEYANLVGFPASGETSKIYTALDTNKIYRWSGSAYVEISASPGSTDAVPEGATNKYFTESRVLATILSGLSTATNAAITAADTVLSALGKLQKQLTDLIASAATKTGAETLSNKTINLANNSVTVDGTNEVGYRNIPQNSKSANYTCALSDAGNHIYHPSADTTARTFTIPANASVAYPIGTALTFVNDSSAGTVTISITTDTMILAGAGTTGSRTLAANGIATALKMTATRWIISGTNLT